MDKQEAKENLVKLLCVNIETISNEDLRKLVKKRYKLWHPDKNPDNPNKYRDQFSLLNESFKVYTGPDGAPAPSDSGYSAGFSAEDIFCDEKWDPDWDLNSDESDYNSTPFDDEFFNASPKKNFAIPEGLRFFFRSKSNRRAGKLFMVFSFADRIHRECFESFSKNHIIKSLLLYEGRTNKEIFCCIIVTQIDQRLLDVKKNLRKYSLSNVELFYAVNIYKLVLECENIFRDPIYEWGEKIKKKTTDEKGFDNKALVDFACSHEITEVFTLMYEYAHLADPCDRSDISKEHDDDHINELLNAKKYVNLPDRKRVAKNAIDCVTAKLFRQLSQLSNVSWLEMRSREFSERLSEVEDCKIFGQAYFYWKYVLKPENFYEIFSHIIAVFTNSNISNAPARKLEKKRFLVFRGNFNSGKTTLAAAICKFFDGVNINLNVSKDRLQFYLGSAIGKRFVLFDDVKGYKSHHNLPCGPGLSNLDDMREHLDGKIEIQLEKKNQNPINQVFPTGIITMNKYSIPGSLKVRLTIFDMTPSKHYICHPYPVTMDTIFLGLVQDNLIPCDKDFIAYFLRKRDQWISSHVTSCKCMDVVSNFKLWVPL